MDDITIAALAEVWMYDQIGGFESEVAKTGATHVTATVGRTLQGSAFWGSMFKRSVTRLNSYNTYAPRVATVQIQTNRIGDLIGPGGKHIKALQADTETKVDVSDDGLVKIFASSKPSLEEARARVIDLTGVPEVGVVYEGRVVAVKEFGSFVRLFQGIDGLLAGVELTEGQPIQVKVSGVNDRGKLVLERA